MNREAPEGESLPREADLSCMGARRGVGGVGSEFGFHKDARIITKTSKAY